MPIPNSADKPWPAHRRGQSLLAQVIGACTAFARLIKPARDWVNGLTHRLSCVAIANEALLVALRRNGEIPIIAKRVDMPPQDSRTECVKRAHRKLFGNCRDKSTYFHASLLQPCW